jgi:hypothetical protein
MTPCKQETNPATGACVEQDGDAPIASAHLHGSALLLVVVDADLLGGSSDELLLLRSLDHLELRCHYL